jgi:hypothetical protein
MKRRVFTGMALAAACFLAHGTPSAAQTSGFGIPNRGGFGPVGGTRFVPAGSGFGAFRGGVPIRPFPGVTPGFGLFRFSFPYNTGVIPGRSDIGALLQGPQSAAPFSIGAIGPNDPGGGPTAVAGRPIFTQGGFDGFAGNGFVGNGFDPRFSPNTRTDIGAILSGPQSAATFSAGAIGPNDPNGGPRAVAGRSTFRSGTGFGGGFVGTPAYAGPNGAYTGPYGTRVDSAAADAAMEQEGRTRVAGTRQTMRSRRNGARSRDADGSVGTTRSASAARQEFRALQEFETVMDRAPLTAGTVWAVEGKTIRVRLTTDGKARVQNYPETQVFFFNGRGEMRTHAQENRKPVRGEEVFVPLTPLSERNAGSVTDGTPDGTIDINPGRIRERGAERTANKAPTR